MLPGAPLIESIWMEPHPDDHLGADDDEGPETRCERRGSVEIAVLAARQHVPARQRASLIPRDLLGFSAGETAEALDATVASVNGALQRARAAMDERLPIAAGRPPSATSMAWSPC